MTQDHTTSQKLIAYTYSGNLNALEIPIKLKQTKGGPAPDPLSNSSPNQVLAHATRVKGLWLEHEQVRTLNGIKLSR